MNETSDEPPVPVPSSEKPQFFREFRKEIVSGLVMVPIIWLLARVLHTEGGSVEFLAAPVVLAWFAARGWKTDDATWPGRLPIWKFIPKFLLATTIVLGLPLMICAIIYGCILILRFHEPPYLLLTGYIAAVLASSGLVWIGRRVALRSAMFALGLSQAAVGTKARFATYWLVSLIMLGYALWPEPPDFNTVCDYGRQAGGSFFDNLQVTTSLEGVEFAKCNVHRAGNGFLVTIGKVMPQENGRRAEIIHFKATVYPNGSAHHIALVQRDPRKDN